MKLGSVGNEAGADRVLDADLEIRDAEGAVGGEDVVLWVEGAELWAERCICANWDW
jgi:hypothetical protein